MVTPTVEVRPLASQADYRACVALQRDTWGADFQDAVPPSILLVCQKVGGVAAGAFAEDGTLLGFVFGLTGVENGSVVHWSDMLAVRPEAQNLGLGRRLKEFQRATVARLGARVIYWTYDPLMARNAHLNFNVFGVRVVQYVREMYGDETGSDLHRHIGTDRLVVAWPVADAEIARRKRETSEARQGRGFTDAPVIGDADRPDRATETAIGHSRFLRIAVPHDVSVLLASDLARAARWREANRHAFEAALRAGYSVSGFTVATAGERGYYLLEKRDI